MSKKSGVPFQGRGAAEGEGSVQSMWRREPYRKKLRQLLEMEGTEVEKEGEGIEGVEGESKRRRKSGEVHNATSESSVDENRPREDGHP